MLAVPRTVDCLVCTNDFCCLCASISLVSRLEYRVFCTALLRVPNSQSAAAVAGATDARHITGSGSTRLARVERGTVS